MKANELLFWLSARREGSWRQFRDAVKELHSAQGVSEATEAVESDNAFPLHQRLRLELKRLAHVEFFARDCENGWRVAPPTLAAHPVPGGTRAILCGARSPALVERAIRASKDAGCACETLVLDGVPDVIRVFAPNVAVMERAARHPGVGLQLDAPLALLSHLPPCDPPSRGHEQSEFPVGKDVRIREFDVAGLGWQRTDRQCAQAARTGLFEFQLYDRWRYFLRWAGGTFELPRAVGLYSLLRRHRRRVVRFDARARTLSLPGVFRPPPLLERALVLCSGFPPSFDPATGVLTYVDVPPDIALFGAELLRQRLT